jgi:hypothetical protein
LQTIYDDDEAHLEAIAIDEASGKIATCAGSNIRVYKPYGQGEDALKVSGGVPVGFGRTKADQDTVVSTTQLPAQRIYQGVCDNSIMGHSRGAAGWEFFSDSFLYARYARGDLEVTAGQHCEVCQFLIRLSIYIFDRAI